MTTLYLDIDDEITSAAARMRAADDARIALVLPSGSRVATSRINFRLLAREAQARDRSLAIVTPEASARALAASAGLPVFATVAEYEEAAATVPDRFDETTVVPVVRDESRQRRGPIAAGSAAGAAAAGGAVATGAGTANGAHAGGRRPAPDSGTTRAGAASGAGVGASGGARPAAGTADAGGREESRGRRGRLGLIVFLILLALVLAVGGVAGYMLLPSATIVVTPRVEAARPLNLTVRADPGVTTADPAHAVVPAQRQPFPLQASRQFAATGRKVSETKATGSVHWTNCDPTASYTVAGGSIVRTASGVSFTTAGPVFLPVAILTFPGGQPMLTCQGADVAISAVNQGTSGNVGAGSVNIVPPNLNANVIKVTNPAATSGGTHKETQLVAKADVDGAVAALQKQLDQALTAALAAAVASSSDATVFPATRSIGTLSYSTDPNSFVGQQISSFTLGASATGFATAVDEGTVRQLAADRLTAQISADQQLVPGSVTVTVGPGRVDGQAVVFPATARAGQVRKVDAAALREQVKGLTVQAARDALARYGDATIKLSPDWAGTIPTFDFRLDVRVVPVPSAPPSGSASPSTSPTAPRSSSSTAPGPGKSSPAPSASAS